MGIVAVAGGLGDLGQIITKAIADRAKHHVYILSGKAC